MLQYKYAVFFCVFFPFLLNQVKEVVLQFVAHNCPTGSFFVESIGVFIFVFVLQTVAQCVFSQYTICNTKFLYYNPAFQRFRPAELPNSLGEFGKLEHKTRRYTKCNIFLVYNTETGFFSKNCRMHFFSLKSAFFL